MLSIALSANEALSEFIVVMSLIVLVVVVLIVNILEKRHVSMSPASVRLMLFVSQSTVMILVTAIVLSRECSPVLVFQVISRLLLKLKSFEIVWIEILICHKEISHIRAFIFKTIE